MDFSVNRSQLGNTQVIRYNHRGKTAVTIVVIRNKYGNLISLTVSVDPDYDHYLSPSYLDIMVRNALHPGKNKPLSDDFDSDLLF